MPKDRPAERGWIVGRKEGAAVRLDDDPFVSAENAGVDPERDGFKLLDLRTFTNGTSVNFQRLSRGGETRLSPGDVIGVGASLLVFQAV